MQLVAYGAQDVYLTGNPQITFWKVTYRRHTNFAMESIEQTFNGSVDFGNRVSATISRNGDLVHRMYLEHKVVLTGIDGQDTYVTANYGHRLIKEVELEIGGQKIDKQTGLFMEVWAELTEPNPTGNVGQTDGATSTTFQKMSGMGGVEYVSNACRHFIPLQFWFCRNIASALPLVALQYHEVELAIQLNPFSKLKPTTFNCSV